MSGFLLINKDVNMTSFDVIRELKHILHTKHIGHCGTLDPFATGLLVVGVDKACKFLSYVEADFKIYKATLKLGKDTDTLDLEGKIIDEKSFNHVNKDMILNTFNRFIGDIKQIPPMYSALKQNGKKLYELAREGIEVERKERNIHIDYIKLISFEGDEVIFECKCSKGTYIRTLGNDIAHSLNTCGHLIKLERIQIGNLKVSDALRLDEVSIDDIKPIEEVLTLPKYIVKDDKMYRMIKNGMTVKLDCDDDEVMCVDKDEHLIAIYYKNDKYYKCRRGY